MLAPFRAEMQMFSRDGGTGVLLYDARKHEYVPTYAELVNGTHDLVGLPKYTGHVCCGSLIGSCLWCCQRGKRFTHKGGTSYTGAVRFLPAGHALRTEHEALFAETSDRDPRKRAHALRAPKTRTRAMATASMEAAVAVWENANRPVGQLPACSGLVDFDKADKKQYNQVVKELKAIGFVSQDAFSKWLPYHQPVAHSVYCTPHLVGNRTKDILRFVSNQGDKQYKRKYQESEAALTPTRFAASKQTQAKRDLGHKRFKHMGSGANLKAAEDVIDSLKLWKGAEVRCACACVHVCVSSRE